MDIFETIKTRRSIRQFTDEPVPDEVIDTIIEAGTWAPSGLNNQPWKFAVIKDPGLKTEISDLTHYSRIVLSANTLIAVFLDHSKATTGQRTVRLSGHAYRTCFYIFTQQASEQSGSGRY